MAVIHIPDWIFREVRNHMPILLAFLHGLIICRWFTREAKDVVRFRLAYPQESQPGWKGPHLANPKLTSHEEDPTLLPRSSPPPVEHDDVKDQQKQEFITCWDPSTDYHISTVPADSRSSIHSKVLAAHVAQKTWRKTSFKQRRVVMRSLLAWVTRDVEEISRVGMRDTGKTMLDSAFGEILTTCSKLEFMINHGETYLAPERRPGNWILSHKISTVYYEPLGVVAAIVSWNYPFHNALSPIIASLFAGNAIVLKCSEQVAWSSRVFVEGVRQCLKVCGFEEDLVQLVVCYPDQASALTEHPLIRHITFIGSEQVGRIVASSAAKNLIPCTMELGGKDPAILLPSVDLGAFESTFMRSTFQSVGQGCIATERFYVHSSKVEEFVSRMKGRIEGLRLGSELDAPSGKVVDCGSMVNDVRFDDFERRIQSAVKEGAEVVCGGQRLTDKGGRAFFGPTLLRGVKNDMEIVREEVFGPVVLVLEYETVGEAVEMANDSRFGLGAAVYGRDKKQAEWVAQQLECGMVSINDFGVFYINQAMPFGGQKASGYGRFGGPEGLRALTNVKAVVKDRFHGWIQTSIPPAVDYPVKDARKSALFVQGLVRLFFFSSWSELGQGVKQLVQGSL